MNDTAKAARPGSAGGRSALIPAAERLSLPGGCRRPSLRRPCVPKYSKQSVIQVGSNYGFTSRECDERKVRRCYGCDKVELCGPGGHGYRSGVLSSQIVEYHDPVGARSSRKGGLEGSHQGRAVHGSAQREAVSAGRAWRNHRSVACHRAVAAQEAGVVLQ